LKTLESVSILVAIVALALILTMMGTALISRPRIEAAGQAEILIIGIYQPGEVYPGSQWTIDYLTDNKAGIISMPSAEHIERLIQHWEQKHIVTWLGEAD